MEVKSGHLTLEEAVCIPRTPCPDVLRADIAPLCRMTGASTFVSS